MPGFKEIRIISYEDCSTHVTPQSEERSDSPPIHPGAQKRCIHLKLSARPPMVWQNMFHAIWNETQDVHWRDAKIEEDCIVIKASTVELEIHLSPLLQQAVGKANARYRE